MRTIENTAALEANLLSGEIDYIAGEDGISLDQAIAFEKRHGDRFEVGTAQQEIQANRAYLDIDIDGDSSEEEEKQVENINALRTYSFRLKQGTAQDVKKYASQD